jgi:hypothetical protein
MAGRTGLHWPLREPPAPSRKTGRPQPGRGPTPFILTAADSACPANTAQLTLTVTIPAGGSGSVAPYSVGMEAEWRFDECANWDGSSYDVVDSLGNLSYYGVAQGGVSATHSGKYCRAALFDGGDDVIRSADFTGSELVFTRRGHPVLLDAHQRGRQHQSTLSAPDRICRQHRQLKHQYRSSATVRGRSCAGLGHLRRRHPRRGDRFCNGGVNDNQWHHLTYTYSFANGGRLYIDGILRDTGTMTI